MRLAVTSDLHLPRTPAGVIEGMVTDLAAHAPDAAVLAGDLGESSDDFEPCLALFRKLACPALVLAGNHDVFPGGSGSRRLWQPVLPEAVRRLGLRRPEGEPFFDGGGTVARDDYSAADRAARASRQEPARWGAPDPTGSTRRRGPACRWRHPANDGPGPTPGGGHRRKPVLHYSFASRRTGVGLVPRYSGSSERQGIWFWNTDTGAAPWPTPPAARPARSAGRGGGRTAAPGLRDARENPGRSPTRLLS
jgi:hypothetical protein